MSVSGNTCGDVAVVYLTRRMEWRLRCGVYVSQLRPGMNFMASSANRVDTSKPRPRPADRGRYASYVVRQIRLTAPGRYLVESEQGRLLFEFDHTDRVEVM